MVTSKHNSILIRFIAAFTIVLLFGILLFPAMVVEKASDCDEKCDVQCESDCDCIGCPLVTLGYITPNPGNRIVLNIENYSIATSTLDIESEFLKRIDRPPQTYLC